MLPSGGWNGNVRVYVGRKRTGKDSSLGVTAHKLNVAKECIESGLYETLQYPLSYLSSEKELELVKIARNVIWGILQ